LAFKAPPSTERRRLLDDNEVENPDELGKELA